MYYFVGVTLTKIASDVSLAFVAFFAGAIGTLLYSRFNAHREEKEANIERERSAPSSANDVARTSMAAQQLRDLARNVASDVGDHNTFVAGITSQLTAIDQSAAGIVAHVMEVAGKMLDANKKLQTRLSDAERKIEAQAQEIRHQQCEARTDALTGLANRRAFDAFLMACHENQAAYGQQFAMIMLDVDNFKQFNDQHGHPAGDEVLRTVARTMHRALKPGDLACRYGGEEFAVIMVNARPAEAQIVAERIRKAIEAMNVQYAGSSLRITASVGAAACFRDEDTSLLVRRADEAVYDAKKHGRNCSFWHDGDAARLIANPKRSAAAEDGKSLRSLVDASSADQVKQYPDKDAFASELRRRIAESRRYGFPLTLLHFRVRSYKRLENEFGAAVGKLLLNSLASFVQSALRDMDLLAQLDGGELVVMLPGSSASAAKIVGQRVRTSISLCPVPLGSQQIRLDLDMGVASVHPDDEATAAMASARADMEASAAVETQEQTLLPDMAPSMSLWYAHASNG